jgi:hypothetical protein
MDIWIYMVQVMGNPTVPSEKFGVAPCNSLGPKGPGISMIWEENENFEISTQCIKCFKLQLAWKSVNNNWDYTYKVKNIGFGSTGAPHGS